MDSVDQPIDTRFNGVLIAAVHQYIQLVSINHFTELTFQLKFITLNVCLQGTVMGILTAVGSLSRAVGPAMFTSLFQALGPP